MMKNVFLLLKVSLLQKYGLNEARYSKDRKKRGRFILMGACFLLVGIMLAGYITGMAWSLCIIGAADSVPGYMLAVTSIVIFFFTAFKSGSMMFQMQTYEMLIALPVTVKDIVVSRFLNMYLEELVLTAVTMIPSCIVYAAYVSTGVSFWLMVIVSIFAVPLFPMVIATLIGTVITAAGARVKHRNIINMILSMALVVIVIVVCYLPMLMGQNSSISAENIGNIGAELTGQINAQYFLAGFYTAALSNQNIGAFLLFLAVSLGSFALFAVLVERKFVSICTALIARSAKGNYKIGKLKQSSVVATLYKKEIRRYLSSNVYVTNTAVGYVLMILMALAVLVIGTDKIENMMQMPGIVEKVIPLLLCFMTAMSVITVSSISLEGKSWWIPMSLPIRAKELADSKILVQLTFSIPSSVLAAALIGIRLHGHLWSLFFLFVTPVVYSIFSAVFGLFINLKLPMLTWDNEVTVVKQSMGTLAASFSSFFTAGIPIVFVFFLVGREPMVYLVTNLLVLVLSGGLYRYVSRFDLKRV